MVCYTLIHLNTQIHRHNMIWNELLLKHWDVAQDLVGINEFKNDPQGYISQMQLALNNEVESTEFMLNDTLTKVSIKLKSSNSQELCDFSHDVTKKIAEANNKKKTHSEVFTKPSGAGKVIRNAFRKNPAPFLSMDSKLLEVSFGTGNFILAMVDFLMESLRSDAAVMYSSGKKARAMSEQELRSYILDNMIYGVELQGHFPPMAIFMLDPDQTCTKLHTHLYQGNSLLFDYVFNGEDMKGKFDVVFGNPPYNVIEATERSKYKYSNESWVTTREAGALHTYFIRLALDLLKKGGMMLYVTRASVLVTDNVSDFREEVLKKKFDIQMVYIPQCGTLFEGAQTTGMGLMAIKKDETDLRSSTKFIRFVNNVEHECEYTIKDSDTRIPLLWGEQSVEIWNTLSALGNRFETYKGIGREETKSGKYKLLDSIGKSGAVYQTTNFNKDSKRAQNKAGRTSPKILVSTGCTDATGERVYWLEGLVKDTQGELEYTGNICAIVNKTTLDKIENTLTDPVIAVYGSLFRTDRNVSSAHYRMISYDYSQNLISKETIQWAKEQLK